MADDWKKQMREHAQRVCGDKKPQERSACIESYEDGYSQGRLDTAFKLGAFDKLIAKNIAERK
jgi:hypothetical protein